MQFLWIRIQGGWPGWFWLGISHEAAIAMAAGAVVNGSFVWGWKTCLQGVSVTGLLQELSPPCHMGLSMGPLKGLHDMAASFP